MQPSAEFELEALKESDVPAWHADLDGAFANPQGLSATFVGLCQPSDLSHRLGLAICEHNIGWQGWPHCASLRGGRRLDVR